MNKPSNNCKVDNKPFNFLAVPVIYIHMAVWRDSLQTHFLHPGKRLQKHLGNPSFYKSEHHSSLI